MASMTIGVEAIVFAVLVILHSVNPTHHGPAGGITNLGHGLFVLSLLGTAAASIAGASAGADDLSSGVFKELVVTGRSRLALFAARVPGGLAFFLPFTVIAYAIDAGVAAIAHGSLPAPSFALVLAGGAWVIAQAAFYFVLGLGVGALTGSRAYSIGILLAWTLILSRIISAISFLGVLREIVPSVHFGRLAPHALQATLKEGPHIGVSLTATSSVLAIWVIVWLTLGAWRTSTRDA